MATAKPKTNKLNIHVYVLIVVCVVCALPVSAYSWLFGFLAEPFALPSLANKGKMMMITTPSYAKN